MTRHAALVFGPREPPARGAGQAVAAGCQHALRGVGWLHRRPTRVLASLYTMVGGKRSADRQKAVGLSQYKLHISMIESRQQTMNLLHQLQESRVDWYPTTESLYVFQADFKEKTVQLRLNDFPDEP